MKLGEVYEVDVTDLSPNGEGVTTVEGFSVFVAKGKPGEHLKVRITRIDSMSADAIIVA